MRLPCRSYGGWCKRYASRNGHLDVLRALIDYGAAAYVGGGKRMFDQVGFLPLPALLPLLPSLSPWPLEPPPPPLLLSAGVTSAAAAPQCRACMEGGEVVGH